MGAGVLLVMGVDDETMIELDSIIELESSDGVGVGVVEIEFDGMVGLELAEGVGVGEEDTSCFWYKFRRLPAPQYSVVLPAHNILHSVAGRTALPVPRVAPQ